MKLLFIFLVFLATDCDTSNDLDNQEVEKAKLESLNKEIKTIAIASQCSDEYTCFSIGFGSKPCGGHWEYLVYSNSIDVVDFLAKINAYNELEEMFNKKYNIMSDCMLVMAPSKTICENGKCKAVYDN